MRKSSADASKGQNSCAVESRRATIFDGYNDSQAWLEVEPSALLVKSESVLDPSFSDIVLSVDRRAQIPFDRVEKGRSAILSSQVASVVAQFRAGKSVTVQLRFWPTWPATGTHTATFSLQGFSKAYDALKLCQR
jgi:hypothetical protein